MAQRGAEKQGLSDREAAKVAGVSHVAIGKARRAGIIATLADGTVTAEAVAEWQVNRREPRGGNLTRKPQVTASTKPLVTTPAKSSVTARAKPPVSIDGPAAELAAAAMAAVEAEGGVFATRPDAQRHADSYTAHLRRLEYERERGRLIETEKVAEAMEADYGRVRTRLLAIPAEQALRLHRLKTVTELQDALQAVITEALEELSRGAQQQLG